MNMCVIKALSENVRRIFHTKFSSQTNIFGLFNEVNPNDNHRLPLNGFNYQKRQW